MKKTIALIIILLLSISCSEDEKKADTNSTLFSTPPFDLQGINAKFIKDINYDTKPRTQLDIFIPSSSTPTGLVIYIHGGGFINGDKNEVYSPKKGGLWDFPTDIRYLLQNNIAFASIRYSFIENGDTQGVIRSLNDIKRAIQFIKYKNADFNINKNKIVLAGNSAGAGSALWIATHNDMEDVNNTDPVLKESTRVIGAAVREVQATYDIKKWQTDVFIDYSLSLTDIVNTIGTNYFLNFYAITSTSDFNSTQTLAYRNNIDILNLITNDDPEIWVDNTLQDVISPSTQDVLFHHAYHARELKVKYDALSLPNVFYYGKTPALYAHPSNETWINFSVRKIQE